MSAAMRPPPEAVPTLTEVLGFGETESGAEGDAVGASGSSILGEGERGATVTVLRSVQSPASGAVVDSAPVGGSVNARSDARHSAVDAVDAIDEEELAQRVLLDVQRQVDRMFEFRVRESVGPAFGRLFEAFLAETRAELNLTLRDVVRRAVAQELAKHRVR